MNVLFPMTCAPLTGTLVAYQRPANYVERRTDGYMEPELLFILGTAHVSQQSAIDVERVVQVGLYILKVMHSAHA